MIKHIAFFLYPVTNMAAARAFYEGKLGLKLSHQFQDAWMEYDLGDTTFAIAIGDADHPAPIRGGCVAFEVADLDGFVARLKSQGVRFKQDAIIDTPVCRMVSALDPDGNEVILHQLKS